MSSIVSKVNKMVAFFNANRIDDATAYACNGQFEAYEILRNQPGTPKIAIGFERSEARVNFPGGDITGREKETLYAIISRGRGMTQDRAANTYEGVEGGKPLLEDAELLRDAMRAFQFDPVTDEQTDYIGMEEWGKPQGFNIDGFKIRIWVGAQMPNYQPIATAGLPA